jgi:CubicO group peptidase (beta-lactamase class C family)
MNVERVHTGDPDGLCLIQALRSHIPFLMAKHQTPGLNIAVADKGRLIWEAGFGFADIAKNVRMTPDSVYHSGSLGKTYTATAVMILVDRGVLSLSDPINRHLPFRVENPLGPRDVTVLDLMTHRSGLSEDASACSRWEPGQSLTDTLRAEFVRESSVTHGGNLMKRWINPVGTSWAYSNLSIATLGLIVEVANPDHLSFSDFVQREIIQPLGMTHSVYPPSQTEGNVSSGIWRLATTGYSRMGHADIPTIPIYFHEYPAGGVLGRPADHIRLLTAMMNEGTLDECRLFSPHIARSMLSPATELGTQVNAMGQPFGEQGLVWRLYDRGAPWSSFDHGGGHMFGWRTQGRGWPHYKSAVMVATNQWSLPEDTLEVQEVADFVGTWLRYRQPVSASRLSAAALSYVRGALLAGAYRVTFGIPGDIPNGALAAVVIGTRNRGDDWDAASFCRGFSAVAALAPSLAAIREFWRSDACEVDLATVRAGYAALGGLEEIGLLWDLFPKESDVSASVSGNN